MDRLRLCLIAHLSVALCACSAMQGTISSDQLYTSRQGVFRMHTPRLFNLKSPNYFIRDASARDGAVTVDFFASYLPRSAADKVHYTVGYVPSRVIELRWPVADRTLGTSPSRPQEPDIYQKFLEIHVVHVQCTLQRNPGVLSGNAQSPRILLRDLPLHVGDKAVHYSVFTQYVSASPGWRMDGPNYLYFGVYVWQVGEGMMWVLIMADPGRSMFQADIPTAESMRAAAQVADDQQLVASVELLKAPPAGDLDWLQQDAASRQNWCSSAQ